MVKNGVKERNKIETFFRTFIQKNSQNQQEITWSTKNIYYEIEKDLAVYIKFKKTNDVSFDRLEEYRCELLDVSDLINFFNEFDDVTIYRGKLFHVV